MKDVIELVPWVQITQAFSNTRILRRGSLHANGRLRPLAAGFDIPEVGRVADGPVVDFFVPFGNLLILFVIFGRDKVVDDNVF